MTVLRRPAAGFGIASLAISLGELKQVDQEAPHHGVRAEELDRLGYKRFYQAPDGVTSAQIGAAAARTAIERSGGDPASIDYIVVANGATVPDYLNWDVSTAVAAQLGLTSVPTLLLTQGCAAAVLAFEQIAGVFATRPEVRTVLLVAVDRVSKRHVRRMGTTTVDSDGAAAIVFQRGGENLRWLATEQVTDATFADFFRLEFCGSAAACVPDPERNLSVDPAYQVYRHFRDDPDGLIDWASEVDRRVVDAIDGACKRAGTDRSEVSRLLLLNDNRTSMASVAAAAGIPIDRTNARLAPMLGHFGGADPLVCLSLYHERGLLDRGELVALAGLSSGMHWFCTLLEV